jgi:hypothetical protein
VPQIEVMTSDLPHTLWKSSKEKPDGDSPTDSDIDDAVKLNEASMKRLQERLGKKGCTIEELFNGDNDL